MSGGYFDYSNYCLNEFADSIENEIENNYQENEFGDCINYPEDILHRMKLAAKTLRKASMMVHHIDYLLSGDYGLDSFRRHWREDIEEID